MTIMENIKAAQLAARKARNQEASSSLTTLIGEAEAIGKNAGNRAPTDAEVTAVIKKFIKNIDETIKAVTGAGGYAGLLNVALNTERELFNGFLPKQMSEEELTAAISAIVAEVGKTMGLIMKALKDRHEGTYDGAMASKLVKAAIA